MKKNSRVEKLQKESNRSTSVLEQLAAGVPSRVLQSDELFGAGSEVGIMHQGAMYRLRVTRGGKLILNK